MVGYDPKIHSMTHLAKAIAGRVEAIFGGLTYQSDELLVVNYHSTPKKFIENFRQQLEFYQSRFNIISPADLSSYYDGTLKSQKANLLLTFDDGLKNNLNAVQILNEHKIKAFFFLVPDFLNCAEHQQKDYYLKHIRPLVNLNIDSEDEDFTSMNADDIQQLIKNGQGIGCHTMSHTLVASRSDIHNSEKEIVQSKIFLEQKFGIKIDSFCSINNTLESVGQKEKALIDSHYRFHFTTIPGINAVEKNPLFIKRRNLECFWMRGALYYAIGKWDLKRWEEARETFTKL